MGDTLSRMLLPVLTVLISNLVSVLVSRGILTPENASAIQNWLISGVSLGVPMIAAWVVGSLFTKRSVVQQAAALPEVTRIDVAPQLADRVKDSPEVRADPTAPGP